LARWPHVPAERHDTTGADIDVGLGIEHFGSRFPPVEGDGPIVALPSGGCRRFEGEVRIRGWREPAMCKRAALADQDEIVQHVRLCSSDPPGTTPPAFTRAPLTLVDGAEVADGGVARVRSKNALTRWGFGREPGTVTLRRRPKYSAQASGRFRPAPHLGPQPDECALQLDDGLREVGVASAPVVDEVGALHVEAFSDFGGAYEFVDVHLPAHDPETRTNSLGGLRLIVREDYAAIDHTHYRRDIP
jgi:hypothetical protein